MAQPPGMPTAWKPWICTACDKEFQLGEEAWNSLFPGATDSRALCPECGEELDTNDENWPSLEELRETSTPVTDIEEAIK